MKKIFSTTIFLYLRNYTVYGHSYYRTRIGTQFILVQKRQDYPDVSETLQEQVTKLVNVMRTTDGIDRFSDVS